MGPGATGTGYDPWGHRDWLWVLGPQGGESPRATGTGTGGGGDLCIVNLVGNDNNALGQHPGTMMTLYQTYLCFELLFQLADDLRTC